MFMSGLIDLTTDAIYQTYNQFGYNSLNLSSFLLNIYLKDLDFYIFYLSRFFSFKKLIFNKKNYNSLNSSPNYNFLLKLYYPIKVSQLLRINLFIKKIRVLKFVQFKNYYLMTNVSTFLFEKNISYLRYFSHIILGVIGSKNFFNFFFKKILTFVRSSIRFDLEKTSFFSNLDDSIIFLGFNIKLVSLSQKNTNSIFDFRTTKSYFSRILHRLEVSNRVVSKYINTRLNFELTFQLNKIFNLKKLNSYCNQDKDKNFWLYLFQLEAIRSSKYDLLFLTSDRVKTFPEEFFLSLKFKRNLNYQRYLFSLHILKMHQLLKEIVKTSVVSKNSLYSSFDISFDIFLNEYRKKLFFFYNKFFFQYSYKMYYRENIPKDSLYNIRLYSKDNLLQNTKNVQIFKYSSTFEIFFPLNFSIEILRKFGLFHAFKFRAIGKSAFLKLDDMSIIKTFGSISYLFLNWYRCCFNFSFVKKFINILRESCFLTLCRKHNKNKTWVYEVYTYDLNIFDNLFSNKSFFPSRSVLSQMKRKFFMIRFIVFFDERFFLNS